MEESLYFKPEMSGKKKNGENKKEHKLLKLFCFFLLLLTIVLIIIWLLRGSKTISGQYPENIKNEALTCESTNIDYSKITSTKSEDKSLKINLVFSGKDKLKSASLIYTLYYSSKAEVVDAEAFAHAEFNNGLYDTGFDVDKFSNKFARYDDRLIISLFANQSDITEYTTSYFMIDANDKTPTTINEYQNNYELQGFACKSTIE